VHTQNHRFESRAQPQEGRGTSHASLSEEEIPTKCGKGQGHYGKNLFEPDVGGRYGGKGCLGEKSNFFTLSHKSHKALIPVKGGRNEQTMKKKIPDLPKIRSLSRSYFKTERDEKTNNFKVPAFGERGCRVKIKLHLRIKFLRHLEDASLGGRAQV